jgi:hypothetical protein
MSVKKDRIQPGLEVVVTNKSTYGPLILQDDFSSTWLTEPAVGDVLTVRSVAYKSQGVHFVDVEYDEKIYPACYCHVRFCCDEV